MIIYSLFFLNFSLKKKEVNLMGGFNINLLNYNMDKDTSDYMILSSPTRITATTKTLMDNTFYNNASDNIVSGYIASSISNHVTQFLLTPGHLTGVQPHKVKQRRSFHSYDPKASEKDIKNID